MRVFVTGGSGWIGSAVVPELIGAGHTVVGLARSDATATALTEVGAEVERGDLDDLDALRRTAAGSDGVIHLAFKHDLAFSGDFEAAADADTRAIEAFGDALAGSDRPLVIASGLLGLKPGETATERDGLVPVATKGPMAGPLKRLANAQLTLSYASKGIRSSVLRLPPTVHGDGDNGFIPTVVGIARATRVSGYVGDGTNRWPAVHVSDAARLFRLSLEEAPAGTVIHGIADEGVAIRDIAAVIGHHLDVPVASVSSEDAPGHFTWLAALWAMDCAASSALTRHLLGWQPSGPGLIADLELGHYFRTPAS